MAKMIRIEDSLYTYLEEEAQDEIRSATSMLGIILRDRYKGRASLGVSSLRSEPNINRMPVQEAVPKELLPRLCKNGHPIPAGRDKCLGKGCKYS